MMNYDLNRIKRKSATSFGTPSKFYLLYGQWASVCVCGALFSLRSSTLRAVDSFIRFYDFYYSKFTSMMFDSGNCSYRRMEERAAQSEK